MNLHCCLKDCNSILLINRRNRSSTVLQLMVEFDKVTGSSPLTAASGLEAALWLPGAVTWFEDEPGTGVRWADTVFMLYNAKKSTRLTKGLVAKYKNTSKEEMPLQDSSDEASIDIEFTNPEGHSSEEDLIESDEELESTDLNNTQTTIGEDEELGESDEVPDTNELNEKVPSSNSDEQSKEVPSVESNEQSKEVDESMFKEDSLRMARGKAPLTKSFVAKFKSTQKDISSSEREIEMNSEDNVVSLRDDENISLMPSSQPIASKRNMRPRVLKATHVEESGNVKNKPS
ncbi:hypothetical protein L6452_37276 [Arctium lappa]|uniref:Uncharacterized protein n=1 Tax=Arctium lappa TaxID=4217 RepID=A0ACB8Y6P1_ARCLA|nr:hypothetical protein L6452_37276 [Arctium lappa]